MYFWYVRLPKKLFILNNKNSLLTTIYLHIANVNHPYPYVIDYRNIAIINIIKLVFFANFGDTGVDFMDKKFFERFLGESKFEMNNLGCYFEDVLH